MDESFVIRSITYIYKIDLFNADFKLIDYHDQLLNVLNNNAVKHILHFIKKVCVINEHCLTVQK